MRMVTSPDNKPFLRYRERLDSYRFAIDNGMSDQAFCDLVEKLDDSVDD